MSNDKKRNERSNDNSSRRPAQDSNVRTDHGSIEFGEDFQKSHVIQNTLPPPEPMPKKEK
jgi:hypothetical protein